MRTYTAVGIIRSGITGEIVLRTGLHTTAADERAAAEDLLRQLRETAYYDARIDPQASVEEVEEVEPDPFAYWRAIEDTVRADYWEGRPDDGP